MPTTRPRYTLTDFGELSEMLDVAARRWPEEHDRKALLMRLAAAGRELAARELAEADRVGRRERQRAALARIARLLDVEVLLNDAAWR